MDVNNLDRLMQRLKRERKVIGGCDTYEAGPSPYLIRYTLAKFGKTRLYVHVFLRSDGGDVLHDHPWRFVSLLLSGGYIEVTPSGRRRKRPGMLLIRGATWAHRVELIDGKPSVSLVWRSDYTRQWGFFTPAGWLHWKSYFLGEGCGDDSTDTGTETKISG
jgi:hypothetical protein